MNKDILKISARSGISATIRPIENSETPTQTDEHRRFARNRFSLHLEGPINRIQLYLQHDSHDLQLDFSRHFHWQGSKTGHRRKDVPIRIILYIEIGINIFNADFAYICAFQRTLLQSHFQKSFFISPRQVSVQVPVKLYQGSDIDPYQQFRGGGSLVWDRQ